MLQLMSNFIKISFNNKLSFQLLAWLSMLAKINHFYFSLQGGFPQKLDFVLPLNMIEQTFKEVVSLTMIK